MNNIEMCFELEAREEFENAAIEAYLRRVALSLTPSQVNALRRVGAGLAEAHYAIGLQTADALYRRRLIKPISMSYIRTGTRLKITKRGRRVLSYIGDADA